MRQKTKLLKIKLPAKGLLFLFGLFAILSISASLGSSKAFACSDFLCGWSRFSNNGQNGDSVSLTPNTILPGSGTPSDPFRLTPGQQLILSLSYNSQNSSNQNVYLWTQIPGNSLPSSISIGDDGRSSNHTPMNGCATIVAQGSSQYYNSNWPGGAGGAITCEGTQDELCYGPDYTPAVSCTYNVPDPSNPGTNTTLVNPRGAISGMPAYSAVWEIDKGAATAGFHSVPIFMNSPGPTGNICLRTHISISPQPFTSDLLTLAKNAYPNLTGLNSSSSTCWRYIAPSGCPSGSCIPGSPPGYDVSVSCTETDVNDGGWIAGQPANTLNSLAAQQGVPGSVSTAGWNGPPGNKVTPNGPVAGTADNTYTYVRVYNGGSPSGQPIAAVPVGGQGNRITYTPGAPQVTITITHMTHLLAHSGRYMDFSYDQQNTSAGYPGYQFTLTCYQARCSINSVQGDLPNGVKAGDNFTVNATLTNIGVLALPATMAGYWLGLTSSSPVTPHNAYGNPAASLVPGDSVPVTMTFTAPDQGRPYTYGTGNVYPDYFGNASMLGFGAICGAPTINVYEKFALNPTVQATLLPTIESPNQVQNVACVTEGGPAPTVSEYVTAELYVIPPGSTSHIPQGSPSSKSDSGAFDTGVQHCLYNNYTYAITIPPEAGQQYCVELDVPATAGWVGPGGDIADGSTGSPYVSCPHVANRPYFKTYGSGVSAGGAFASSGSCSSPTGGRLAGWNSNDGVLPDYGASSQLHAQAFSDIVGFASNQAAFARSPLGLSLANTVNNTGAGGVDGLAYSPNLGGQFDPTGTRCLPDVQPPDGVTPVAGPLPIGGTGTVCLFCSLRGGGPPPRLGGGNIIVDPGSNRSVFVNGDVYIKGNVLYAGDNGGTTGPGAQWNSISNVPSFTLHATGNIYIDPSVTELDGLYIAEPGSSGGGKIYTCGAGSTRYADGTTPGTPYAAMPANEVFDNCKNQLTVYGDFVANQVVMARTFGSLRDETPTPSTSSSTYKKGSDYANCQPFPPGDLPCTPDPSNGTVFNWREYIVKYSFAGLPAGDHALTINYGNYNAAGAPWPPPPNAYSYNVTITTAAPDGTTIVSRRISLPTTYTTTGSSYTINLTGLSANSVITLLWDNNTWTACGSNATCYDPNFEINSLTMDSTGTPPTPNVRIPCSNHGSQSSPRLTCAAEVFDFSPEFYLSTPAIKPPSNGATQYDAITSLPPVL